MFFGSPDHGGFLLKQPQTSPSNQRKLSHLPLAKGLSSTNQNPTIFQACNCRNYKGFQLADTSPFTSQCPQDYTHYFCNTFYLIFHCLYGKKLFKLFASQLESHIISFWWYFWLTYIYFTTRSHVWIHFYLHFPNFTFSFCLQAHFHSVFLSFSFIWLLSLSLIFTIFPALKARLGPYIFIYLQSG